MDWLRNRLQIPGVHCEHPACEVKAAQLRDMEAATAERVRKLAELMAEVRFDQWEQQQDDHHRGRSSS